MKQITVRHVSEDVAKALREESRRRGKSLNQTVLELLRGAVGLDPSSPFDNGLGKHAGTWSEEDLREMEKATEIFEQIDAELWA